MISLGASPGSGLVFGVREDNDRKTIAIFHVHDMPHGIGSGVSPRSFLLQKSHIVFGNVDGIQWPAFVSPLRKSPAKRCVVKDKKSSAFIFYHTFFCQPNAGHVGC